MKHVKNDVPCPVCDGASVDVLYEPWVQEDDPAKLYGAASGIPGTQVLVQCRDCTMIFESPRFNEDAIIDGYKQSNEAAHDTQYPMRVHSFKAALKKSHAHVPKPNENRRVLDIGTAGGAFLKAAEEYGYDAYGLEPSEFLVKEGKKRGLKIEQGTIDDHGFEHGSFDMVTLWDVIEHVVDPKLCLTEARKLLKPGGVLLVNYPDIGTTQAKMAGKKFWWILSVHLHHFTRKTIANLAEQCGFEPVVFRRYWQILQFGYLVQMAEHYKIPLAGQIYKLLPAFIRHISIPYYASQTTMIAKVKE